MIRIYDLSLCESIKIRFLHLFGMHACCRGRYGYHTFHFCAVCGDPAPEEVLIKVRFG
jgi:hypothetical protein